MLRSPIRPVNHTATFCHIRVVRLTTVIFSSLVRLFTLVGKGSGDKRGPHCPSYPPPL